MELTFSQFAGRVFVIAKDAINNANKQRAWPYEQWLPIMSLEEVTRASRLEGERVHVGGTSGGNCWDTGEKDNHRGYTVPHDELEVNCLEDILADICPTITFLQYKRLVKEMQVETLESSENEYYGNSSNYLQKVVNLGNLYDALITVGIIE